MITKLIEMMMDGMVKVVTESASDQNEKLLKYLNLQLKSRTNYSKQILRLLENCLLTNHHQFT